MAGNGYLAIGAMNYKAISPLNLFVVVVRLSKPSRNHATLFLLFGFGPKFKYPISKRLVESTSTSTRRQWSGELKVTSFGSSNMPHERCHYKYMGKRQNNDNQFQFRQSDITTISKAKSECGANKSHAIAIRLPPIDQLVTPHSENTARHEFPINGEIFVVNFGGTEKQLVFKHASCRRRQFVMTETE